MGGHTILQVVADLFSKEGKKVMFPNPIHQHIKRSTLYNLMPNVGRELGASKTRQTYKLFRAIFKYLEA